MVAAIEQILGIGTYTPKEAAFFARVHQATMNRWIFGDTRGRAVVQRQVEAEDEKVVTFLDFVQSLAIRAIRTMHKVPLPRIREAHDEAVKKYNLPFPFARPHATFLLGDSRTILICLGKDDYRPLTGSTKGNRMMTAIVEPFVKNLVFEHDIAVRYRVYKENDREIWMDPRMRFGAPIVTSCGYTARSLWDAYHTEGGTEPAALALGVEESDVEVACSFYDFLVGASAA